MSKTLVHDRPRFLFTATTTGRSSGDPIIVGGIIGICLADVAAGKTVACDIGGTHKLSRQTNAKWTQLQLLYFNTSTRKFTSVATSNSVAGHAAEAASTTATTGKVIINLAKAS